MTIQETISFDMKAAMILKDNPIRDLLRVVIGEFNRESKIVTDNRALAIIKKMHQNAVDQSNEYEELILEKYLPKQMSEYDLTKAIQVISNNENYTSMKDIGKIMGKLKSKYKGSYDGKKAAGIIKNILTINQ